jgi:hypothetical protein
MKTKTEKRACDRNSFSADVSFSIFNKEPSYPAQVMNLGVGGMCFNSSQLLKPGATVCIQLEKIHPESSGTDFCAGLQYVTLAEVKWCKQVPGEETPHYEVGVKFFAPVY